jgi:bacteriorhodopsin
MRHASRIVPNHRAHWAIAMSNELRVIEKDGEALRWAIGCLLACYIEKTKSALKKPVSRQKINSISAIAPVVMSLTAFLIVLMVVVTGWERNLKDEGAAAHIFQLLMVAQMPFILTFLVTTNWKRGLRIVRSLGIQFAAIGLALGSLAFFHL